MGEARQSVDETALRIEKLPAMVGHIMQQCDRSHDRTMYGNDASSRTTLAAEQLELQPGDQVNVYRSQTTTDRPGQVSYT